MLRTQLRWADIGRAVENVAALDEAPALPEGKRTQ